MTQWGILGATCSLVCYRRSHNSNPVQRRDNNTYPMGPLLLSLLSSHRARCCSEIRKRFASSRFGQFLTLFCNVISWASCSSLCLHCYREREKKCNQLCKPLTSVTFTLHRVFHCDGCTVWGGDWLGQFLWMNMRCTRCMLHFSWDALVKGLQ